MAAVELNSTYLVSESTLGAYYRLEANSNDTTSNSNNGTDTSVSYAAAKFNNGAVYNGTTSKTTIVTASTLKPTGAFSISMWVKLTGLSGYFFQSYSQNSNVAGFYIRAAAGQIDFTVGKNTGTTINTDYVSTPTGTTLGTGTFYHVVGVWDGSVAKVYINGVLDATSNTLAMTVAYAATSYQRMGVGNQSGTDNNFLNGTLDDVALFSRALTATEIAGLYAGTLAAPAACGIDKLSTTASYNSVFRTQLVNVGTDFNLERIRIPLTAPVDSGTIINVTAYFDDNSSSVSLPTISSTLYSGQRYIVYHPPELASCKGKNNYLLQFSFTGTTEVGISFPIEITRDDGESK